MGVVVGLVAGVGLLMMWRSLAYSPAAPRQRASRTVGIPQLLLRAGVEGLRPLVLVGVSLGCAAAAGLLMLAVSRTWPVAVVFALAAGYVPVAESSRPRGIHRPRAS